MKIIKVKIEGVTPLICNRFHDEAEQSSGKATRATNVGNKGTPAEQCEKKLYPSIESNGAIIPIVPVCNLFACVIDGGRFFKIGRKQMTTDTRSLIPGFCFIEGDPNPAELLIHHADPWKIDTRAARIPPKTGGRVLIHRPMFYDWRLEFALNLDDAEVSVPLMREIVDAAGMRIGLGDYRPIQKGPYGKFKVNFWEEIARG